MANGYDKLWFEMKVQSTGDMWHVGAVLILEPNANVLVHTVDSKCQNAQQTNCLGLDDNDMRSKGAWVTELRKTYNEWALGAAGGDDTPNRVSFLTHYRFGGEPKASKDPNFYFTTRKHRHVPVAVSYLDSSEAGDDAVISCRKRQENFLDMS